MTATKLTRGMIALTAAALSLAATSGAAHAAEVEVREERGGGWMMKRFDADGDGTISLQEFRAAGDAMFARLDADGDGRISAEEWAAAGPGRGWADGERRGQREAGAGPRAEGRAAHRAERAERMAQYRAARFARLDADGDGYVSRAEFDDARMARFNALDVNGNGVIDADELPQARGERKGYGDRKGEGKGYGERERCRSK